MTSGISCFHDSKTKTQYLFILFNSDDQCAFFWAIFFASLNSFFPHRSLSLIIARIIIYYNLTMWWFNSTVRFTAQQQQHTHTAFSWPLFVSIVFCCTLKMLRIIFQIDYMYVSKCDITRICTHYNVITRIKHAKGARKMRFRAQSPFNTHRIQSRFINPAEVHAG